MTWQWHLDFLSPEFGLCLPSNSCSLNFYSRSRLSTRCLRLVRQSSCRSRTHSYSHAWTCSSAPCYKETILHQSASWKPQTSIQRGKLRAQSSLHFERPSYFYSSIPYGRNHCIGAYAWRTTPLIHVQSRKTTVYPVNNPISMHPYSQAASPMVAVSR